MTESIEDIMLGGYGVWKKNMILGVPYLLNGIINLLILLALATVLVSRLVSYFMRSYVPGVSYTPDIPISMLLFIGFSITVVIFLIMVLNSFFFAGAIGMSKEALVSGRTSLGDMLTYGKKKFLSLFFASILIYLITLLGALLLFIPAVAAFFLGIINLALSLTILGMTLSILYSLMLSIVLIPFSYAIVVSDLAAVEGIKEGYRFFMKNKLSVVFLLFVTMGVSWGCGLILNIITSLFGVIPFFGMFIGLGILLLYAVFIAVVLMPLINLWWTLLYMDRVGIKPKKATTGSSPRDAAPEPETLTEGQFYI